MSHSTPSDTFLSQPAKQTSHVFRLVVVCFGASPPIITEKSPDKISQLSMTNGAPLTMPYIIFLATRSFRTNSKKKHFAVSMLWMSGSRVWWQLSSCSNDPLKNAYFWDNREGGRKKRSVKKRIWSFQTLPNRGSRNEPRRKVHHERV